MKIKSRFRNTKAVLKFNGNVLNASHNRHVVMDHQHPVVGCEHSFFGLENLIVSDAELS